MLLNLPQYQGAHVLVVGDVMLDRYWHGPARRISPEAPVPVVKVERQEERAGGAANVALNIASLGGQATLLGLVGDDEAARALESQLAGLRVTTAFERHPQLPTITKLRVLSSHQQLLRLDFEESFHDADPALIQQRFETLLAGVKVVILSDYDKGTLAGVQGLIRSARAAGIKVLVDPKGRDFDKYAGATLLTPNMGEFEAVVGRCRDDAELISKGHALRQQLQLEALLVTRGEQGMTLLTSDGRDYHQPTRAREVFDVTGAGDTVIATLGASLAAGCELPQACALANAAAGVVVAKLGTSTVSPLELAAAIGGASESGFGVVGEEQLLLGVALAKARGESVVMTNGCFDILHAGHVAYLNEARKLGARLIVAVNSDDSVRRLKGSGRPVNPLERRMAVLAGLQAVDWVVPFGEDTPARLIGRVLPDLLVKGGDYQPDQIAGAEAVWANGGEVRVLKFLDGCSTTEIINAIRR